MKPQNDYSVAALKGKARKAAEKILEVIKRHETPCSGGCKCFYSAQEWEERGEEHGQGAILIVCHDGGSQAKYFNWDYEQPNLISELSEELEELGVYAEQCTGWYSAVYEVKK